MPRRAQSMWRCRIASWRPAAPHGNRVGRTTMLAQSGNTRSWWVRRISELSPILAPNPKRIVTLTFEPRELPLMRRLITAGSAVVLLGLGAGTAMAQPPPPPIPYGPVPPPRYEAVPPPRTGYYWEPGH